MPDPKLRIVNGDRTRLNLVLKIANLGFWDFEPGSESLSWSVLGKSFFGVSPDAEITYSKFLSAVHPEDRDRTHGAIQNALNAEVGEYAVEFRAIGIEDSVERIIYATGVVEFDEQNRATRIIGVSSDVTTERRHERELVNAKVAAQASNQVKSDFLANMSHEIRTPLGAILGFAELAANPTYTEKKRVDYIYKIRRSGELLSKLIDQILDLSKVEAKRINLETTKFSLPATLEEVMSTLSLKASNKGVGLELRSDGKIPVLVETDQLRVKQILLNIVGNAIKFTEEGRVVVTARILPPLIEGKRVTISISVCDTGIGISMEKRRTLFERFSQGDTSMTRRYGGTGLGLALSKELALALGGDLVLKESMPNQGSTFIFFFPDGIYQRDVKLVALNSVDQKNRGEKLADNSGRLDQVRILLVDDSEDNQDMLSESLRSAGAIVKSALNGAEAIEMATHDIFDVILMDLQMPILDGITATQHLREQGFKKPIIALTARAMISDREKSLAQGFNEHLTKPIQLQELIREVAHYTKAAPNLH